MPVYVMKANITVEQYFLIYKREYHINALFSCCLLEKIYYFKDCLILKNYHFEWMEKQSIMCQPVWIPRERAVVFSVTFTKHSDIYFHGWEPPMMQSMSKSECGSWNLWGLGSHWGSNTLKLASWGTSTQCEAWMQGSREDKGRQQQCADQIHGKRGPKREAVSGEMSRMCSRRKESANAKGGKESESVERGKTGYLDSPHKPQDPGRTPPRYWVNTVVLNSLETHTDSRESRIEDSFSGARMTCWWSHLWLDHIYGLFLWSRLTIQS